MFQYHPRKKVSHNLSILLIKKFGNTKVDILKRAYVKRFWENLKERQWNPQEVDTQMASKKRNCVNLMERQGKS